MANTKISALTSATTPLAGTEVLPVVQSSTTKQVSVANLTAGRVVSASSLSASTGNVEVASTSGYLRVNGQFGGTANGNILVNIGTGQNLIVAETAANIYTLGYGAAGGVPTKITDFEVSTKDTRSYGNFVPNTAAKGIYFTANTPAAGMTSQLLNWYEEGTWTPAQGGGLTVIGAFSSTGKYTRIGREVIVSGTVTGATSVAVAAAGIITTNLPFTVGTAGHGNVTNAALTSFAAIICTSTNVTSAGAIAATGTLTFSATYFV